MRFLWLLMATSIFLFACTEQKSEHVHFIIPVNYHGLFVVKPDISAPAPIRTEDGTTTLIIPPNGVLLIRNLDALEHWHSTTAQWSDGKELPVLLSADERYGLRSLSTDQEGNTWFMIGTKADQDAFYKSYHRMIGGVKD